MNFFLETIRTPIRCGLAQHQSRYTINPQARKEILTRLLKLNHARRRRSRKKSRERHQN
jgi:hypothetical protein